MTKNPSLPFPYPRRVIARSLLRVLGRAAIAGLLRLEVTGMENWVRTASPLIVAGNHVAYIEVLLLVCLAPRQVELIGAADVPFGKFAPLVNAYGIIPIQRGNTDRATLNAALGVLHQNGVLGVFPEGGIWNTQLRRGHPGVAWLSQKAQAPILPIGFGGLSGAIDAALKGKRPRVQMNIGQLLPPVSDEGSNLARKHNLQQAADQVMQAIGSLLPPAEQARALPQIRDEQFEFAVERVAQGEFLPRLPVAPAIGQLLFSPVVLDVLHTQNYDVDGLLTIATPQTVERVLTGLMAVEVYLQSHNPYFLSYRFGNATALAMRSGLQALAQQLQTLPASEQIILRPVRQYIRLQDGDSVQEFLPTRHRH
ncbi:MAG TPA: lysophospholipid acyltransferase family protein [Anaerolineales bacterium]|nr:lysophospholipid acyltransferase family protein [Anaerolineales bacterium]